MQRLKKFLPIAVAALLTACGGGGGDSAVSLGPTAEGAYVGTLTGSVSNAFNLLVLENGEYWALYGSQSSSLFSVAGFIQGNGTSVNDKFTTSNTGTFNSTNAKDFSYLSVTSGALSSIYNATAKSISGSIVEGGAPVTFSGSAASNFVYTTPASLTTVAGTWSLSSLTGESITLNVGALGAFTAASSSGCNFTGTITPRPTNKNVYNVSMTFGGTPCALPGQSATGIAVAYKLASGGTQLIVAAVDSTRSNGTAAFGAR